MKIVLQTRFTPAMTIYDTEAPPDPAKAKIAMMLLKPVVAVTDSQDRAYYQTGEFYPSIWRYLAIPVVVGLGWFIIKKL